MEEKYKKFKEYDWVNSEAWQAYYRNLFPTPPPSKILKYKKKFYKYKIDSDFDVNYQDPGEKETSGSSTNGTGSSNSASGNAGYNNYNNYNYRAPKVSAKFSTETNQIYQNYQLGQQLAHPLNNPLLQGIETLLFILFFISLPLRYKTMYFLLVGLLIRTVRLVGVPKFKMEYLQALVMSDSFHVIMLAGQTIADRFNFYILCPIIISLGLYLSENLKSLIKISLLQKLINWFITNKEEILINRAHIELAVAFLIIPGFFLKLNSLITIIVCWQLMRVKYSINPYIHHSFYLLNAKVNEFKNSGQCPAIARTVIDKIQWVFNYMGKMNAPEQGQGNNTQGSSMCNIF